MATKNKKIKYIIRKITKVRAAWKQVVVSLSLLLTFYYAFFKRKATKGPKTLAILRLFTIEIHFSADF